MADSITIQNSNIMPLVDDLRKIINQTRNRVAVNVNAELTLMYWHIGERINREVLGNERAEYGKQIVATVSQQLQTEYGDKGFPEERSFLSASCPSSRAENICPCLYFFWYSMFSW